MRDQAAATSARECAESALLRPTQRGGVLVTKQEARRLAERVIELDDMLKATSEHADFWEAETKRLRRLLSPFAQHRVVRGGSLLDTIGIYVRRGDVADACKEFV